MQFVDAFDVNIDENGKDPLGYASFSHLYNTSSMISMLGNAKEDYKLGQGLYLYLTKIMSGALKYIRKYIQPSNRHISRTIFLRPCYIRNVIIHGKQWITFKATNGLFGKV